MLKRLQEWFKNKYIFSDEITSSIKSPTHQVDERTKATIKRVRKAFKDQESQMQVRAMKAHDPSCLDVSACKKRKCFKWEADKIVIENKE